MVASISWADWASFAVAGTTLALAVMTWRAVKAARNEASSTGQLVLEARRDRELGHAPALTFLVLGWGGRGKDPVAMNARITNVGAGPALGCVLIDQSGDIAARVGFADIGPNQSAEVSAKDVIPTPSILFVPPIEARDQNGRCRSVILCRDVLGRRFRFPVRDDHIYPPEISAPDDGERPAWALEPTFWPD